MINGMSVSASLRLSKDSFHPSKQNRTLPLDQIASHSQSPSWWSPSAQHANTNIADLQLLLQSKARGSFRHADCAWLGCLCEAEHKIAIAVARPGGTLAWHFALGYLPGSCVVCWPAELCCFPGSSFQWLRPLESLSRISLLAVLDAREMQAVSFEWRSPLWQYDLVPGSRSMALSIRAVVTGSPRSLLEVAASQAFWSLPLSTLSRLASHHKIGIPPGASLFEAAYALTQGVLGSSDMETVEIVHKRAVTLVVCDWRGTRGQAYRNSIRTSIPS